MSNESPASHGGVPTSFHLSGIMNGFTQVIAFAGDASAVAVALISTLGTPKSDPIKVETELSPARWTFTWTRLLAPVGPTGKVTSAGSTVGITPITLFLCAALIAL